MPDPGSHAYDVRRTRLRAEYDDTGTNDAKADAAANAELQREHPPVPLGDPDRAAGPRGTAGDSRGDREVGDEIPAPGGVVLRSPAFVDHGMIPAECLDDGPPLEWTQVPDGAAEFAVLCEDLDADGAVHWTVARIPASAGGLDAARLPDGTVVGRAGDATGWRKPDPPVGETHRYAFRLFVLDRPLALDRDFTVEQLRRAAEEHQLARGTLIGRFGR